MTKDKPRLVMDIRVSEVPALAPERVFKLKGKRWGGHYHVSVFSARSPLQTFAKLGDLVLDEADWQALCSGRYQVLREIVKGES